MAVTNYYTVNDEIIGEHTAGQSRLDYLTDALGSVVGTIDQTLTVQSTARYKPYGADLATTGTMPMLGWVGSLGYRRTGRPHSDIYVRRRHPGTVEGRWTTVDPIWPFQPAYVYCGSAPTVQIDPAGLEPKANPLNACYYLVCSGKLAWDRYKETKEIPEEFPETCGKLAEKILKIYVKRETKDPVEECVEDAIKNKGIVGKGVNWICNHLGITTSGYSCACHYGEDSDSCNACCGNLKGYKRSCYSACTQASDDYQGFWNMHCVARGKR